MKRFFGNLLGLTLATFIASILNGCTTPTEPEEPAPEFKSILFSRNEDHSLYVIGQNGSNERAIFTDEYNFLYHINYLIFGILYYERHYL